MEKMRPILACVDHPIFGPQGIDDLVQYWEEKSDTLLRAGILYIR